MNIFRKKMYVLAFLPFLLCASAFTMHGDNGASMQDKARSDLLVICENYREIIWVSLGCCCLFRNFEKAINTEKYQNFQKREEQISQLISIINGSEDWAVKAMDFLAHMAPFRKKSSKAFKIACENVINLSRQKNLIKEAPHKDEQILDDWNACIMCFDALKFALAVHCGHRLYCLDCYKMNKDKLRTCATCREPCDYVCLPSSKKCQ